MLTDGRLNPDREIGGMSLLEFASMQGDICIMRALISNGADVNGPRGKGKPLLAAFTARKMTQ